MNLSRKIEIHHQTDVGQVRDHNEDFVAADERLGLMMLADGMGGLNAGEVASSMTVHLLMETLANYQGQRETSNGLDEDHLALKHAIEDTNRAVFHVSQTQLQCRGMGTTVVAAMISGTELLVGHIGDSRCYRFRHDQLEQITKDHSYVQELMDRGLYSAEEARTSNRKNVVTRALGVAPEVEAEVHQHLLEPGDIYLLCSDGLTDLVTNENIELSLRELGADLSIVSNHLVDLANASGGKDNISIMLLRIDANLDKKESLLQRICHWFE